MPYISYEQEQAIDVVKDAGNLTIPPTAHWVELQASVQNIRYTMDDATDPAQTFGMLLLVTSEPKLFLIQDLQKIRFIRGAAAHGMLNLHYGRGGNF